MAKLRDVLSECGMDLIDESALGTPLTGRVREVGAVQGLLPSRGSSVAIAGEPGAGKTRVALEVLRQTGHFYRSRAYRFLDGRKQDAPLSSAFADWLGSDTDLLLLDDVQHASGWEVAELLAVLAHRGVRTLMTGTSTALVSRGYATTIYPLPPLQDESVLELAGLAASSRYADKVLSIANGNPQAAILAGQALREDHDLPTVLGPDGRPFAPGSTGFQAVELAVKDISNELIAHLAERPESMRELHWRKFEELVAELYAREGYDVQLTRGSKDHGVDIYALHRTPRARFLTIVDCKRYRADRGVGVELVKQLRSTVMDEQACMGVITSTSYFTKGAKDYVQDHQRQLGLQDFASVHDMLKRAKGED